MDVVSILLIGAGLSMDAFAVSVCKGLALGERYRLSHSLKAGAYFGFFQALMPLLGYCLGSAFSEYVEKYSPFLSFALLAFVGGKMLYEAIKWDGEERNADMDVKTMLLLALATSIDAFAVGVALAMQDTLIFPSVALIGVTTFIFSLVGVKIGNLFGAGHNRAATAVGGLILFGLGVRFLISGIIG